MPVFKLTRTRRYEAHVQAPSAKAALRKAPALVVGDSGWRCVEDVVDGDVYGVDSARQHLSDPFPTPKEK